jgi:hypothetical protein
MRSKAWAAAATAQTDVSAVAPSRTIEPFAGDGPPHQGSLGAGLALRHLLRMIAYDPTARVSQHTLARLRPFVDGARLELQRRHDSDGPSDAYLRGAAELMDGAVAGLCHVARFCADGIADSMVAAFAAVAVGRPERREPSALGALDLLFLVSENAAARERADRMVAFVLTGLSELGFSVNHASCTLAEVALLADAVPALATNLRDLRFVWGCYSLYADLADHRPKSASRSSGSLS